MIMNFFQTLLIIPIIIKHLLRLIKTKYCIVLEDIEEKAWVKSWDMIELIIISLMLVVPLILVKELGLAHLIPYWLETIKAWLKDKKEEDLMIKAANKWIIQQRLILRT